MKIKYYESKLNLAWKPILKHIMQDPQAFIDDVSVLWSVLCRWMGGAPTHEGRGFIDPECVGMQLSGGAGHVLIFCMLLHYPSASPPPSHPLHPPPCTSGWLWRPVPIGE